MEKCSLCIIGAGYSGWNALNSAGKYLAPKSSVIVVDRGYRWGGQWADQYSFCKLHVAYQVYTAGEREWAIKGSKPVSHLASRGEVLSHFDDVVEAVVKEKELDLVMLFGYEYRGHEILNGRVEFTAVPLLQNGALPVSVVAEKLIKAFTAGGPPRS